MSGAKENLTPSLAVRSNNLANANTLGFKADFEESAPCKPMAMVCCRVFSMAERRGKIFNRAVLQTTGRELDVAVRGDGWLTVQDKDGKRSLYRNGSLQVSPLGVLQHQQVSMCWIAPGSRSRYRCRWKNSDHRRWHHQCPIAGAEPAAVENLQQLKLVNPVNKEMTKARFWFSAR